jgi:RimJ/RimL family protein N-acetyltransferase
VTLGTLLTARLVLDPFRESDLDDLASLNADAEVTRPMLGVRTLDETRAELGRILAAASDPPCGGWVIRFQNAPTFIGRVGIKRNVETGEHELLYALHKAYWRNGYASEAAARLLTYAFTHACTRVMACALPDNHASIGVMQKIGMVYARHDRMYGHDVVVYVAGMTQA